VSVALIGVLAGALLAVQAEEERGLSPEESRTLMRNLSSAVEGGVRDAKVVIVEPSQVSCPSDQRCGGQIREVTGAEEVVFVRMIAIAATIRLIAERESARGAEPRISSRDLTRDEAMWASETQEMVRELFPDQPKAPIARRDLEPVEPPPAVSSHLLAWTAVGAGALALCAGIVFGVENRSAISEGGRTLDPMRPQQLESKTRLFGIAADTSFVIAGLSAAAAIILYEIGQ
jgi:hypothetical protein